ncbi:MAG TPA: retropepsin-like aspartic protease [Candidatus Baltobacteraceae bacterium]
MAPSSRVAKFLLLCMTLSMMNPVAAQQMDAASLQQRMIEAQGKPPDQYREEIITSSSLEGTYLRREYHRGLDYRIVYGTGAYQHQAGRVEGREWDQDANGITTVHDSTPSQERVEPRRVTVTRVNQPVSAWRITDQDVHGYGTIRYLDPSNYHLVRVENLTPTGTITTVYDEFRADGGYTTAHHMVTDDATTGAHIDANVITFTSTTISDADLAMPPSRKFIEFPAGSGAVTLPTDTNPPHVTVRVTIGDRTFNFLLDTSSQGITLDANVARQIGLINTTQTLLANARRTGVQATIPEMRVGALRMHNVVVSLGPVSADQQIASQAVGALGYDFFRSATVTFDHSKRRVTAVPSDQFVAPVMTPDSDILRVRVIDHQPTVSAKINGAPAERIVLDTGAGADMILFGYFVRRYPEIFTSKLANPQDPTLYGGAKEPDAKGYRMQEVDIGRYNFKPFDVITIDQLKNYSPETDGLMGPGMLDHFAASLDLLGGKLYLLYTG